MTTTKNDAWSKNQAEQTLQRLRKSYPGYTDNELYAIWCHSSGRIPLDESGKVLLEQWRIHAEEDGKHLGEDRFKVSRALYGRALRAEVGVPKPRLGARRKPVKVESLPVNGAKLSPKALELAQTYDQAARLIDAVVRKRREIEDLFLELQAIPKPVAAGLAEASPEAKKILAEADALRQA